MSYEVIKEEYGNTPRFTQESRSFLVSLKKFFSPRKKSNYYSGYIKDYGEETDEESPEMVDFEKGLEKSLF